MRAAVFAVNGVRRRAGTRCRSGTIAGSADSVWFVCVRSAGCCRPTPRRNPRTEPGSREASVSAARQPACPKPPRRAQQGKRVRSGPQSLGRASRYPRGEAPYGFATPGRVRKTRRSVEPRSRFRRVVPCFVACGRRLWGL